MTYTLQKISIALSSFFLLLFLLTPLAAKAQDSLSFSVSPTIFDMTANPGQTWQSTVRIINANPYELRIFIDVTNFAPKGEGGTPRFIPVDAQTEPNSTLAQWVTTEREIIVAPEQTIELPLKITLPNTAAPGGHFAALMISTRPKDAPGQPSQVQTSQVITSLIFLRVSGDISEISSIRSFRTTSYILSKPEATFELRIENKGNVHVQPQGEIKIFNMWGQERGTIPVNQQTLFGNVLPNSVRKYSFTWNSEWSITDIGRYTAVAALVYGNDGRQSMTADTAFWVIPWKILLVIFLVVGGFITLVSWAIKIYVRHMLKLAGITPGGNHISVSAVESIAIATKKNAKRVSVVAPLEAGMLDLRTRLERTSTLKTYLKTVLVFVRAYWKFFAVIAAVIVFVALAVWFFSGALTPSRDFEVTIDSEGQSVTVTSEEPSPVPSESPAPAATSSSELPISLINRSGSEALTEEVKTTLNAAGYDVVATDSDFGAVEEKTVIVYPPEFADEALALSGLLQNALLSSYTPQTGEQAEIVIYIGTDAEMPE